MSADQYEEYRRLLKSDNAQDILDLADSTQTSLQASADYSDLALSLSVSNKGKPMAERTALINAAGKGNVQGATTAMDAYIKKVAGMDTADLGGDADTIKLQGVYQRATAAKSDDDLRAMGVSDDVLQKLGGDFASHKDAAALYLGRKAMLEDGGKGGIFSDQTGEQLGILLKQLTLNAGQQTEILQKLHGEGSGKKQTADITYESWDKNKNGRRDLGE